MNLAMLVSAAAAVFLGPQARLPLHDHTGPRGCEAADPADQSSADAERVTSSRPGLEPLKHLDQVAEGVWRIDGPTEIAVVRGERRGVTTYSFGDRMLVETKLPRGYPRPTAPDSIEIKAYPAVRRAEVNGSGNPDLGMNIAFWPLFQHIDRNGIEMTAPVEIDYRLPEMARLEEVVRPEAWTMAFLYEQTADGPAGTYGRVEVVDREPRLVLATGLRGSYRSSRMQEALERLTAWLDAHPEWEAAGDPRMLGYNGPERRASDRWSEVQIPIRPTAVASEDAAPVE